MTQRLALGIDVGTTSVKVLLLDEAGRVVGSAAHHHGISEHDERVEVDADRWWDSLCAALRKLGTSLDGVGAIGLSGNMSSVVVVDGALRPLRPALLLADARGTDQLLALDDDITARIVDATGNIPETVFSLASLLWLRDVEPELLAAGAAVLTSKDYLRARLTGVTATDPTDAGNTLLVRDGEWDASLIAALGLPARLFPPLRGSGAPAGTVSAAAARATGLRAGTPVATGAGDVAGALAGSGGLPPHALAVSLGTSATVMASLSRGTVPTEALGKLTVHPDADGGTFALGSLLTGGLALNWLRSSFGDDILRDVDDAPLDAGLFFLPYLAGTGSPDFVNEMRGTVFGITAATRPADLLRALLEAVAFDIADLVATLGESYTSVLVSGGGSRIPAWPQVLADVLDVPVTRFDAPDLSAVGAAILGWRAVGAAVAPAGDRIEVPPRAAMRARWTDRRARYRQARANALDHYLTSNPL